MPYVSTYTGGRKKITIEQLRAMRSIPKDAIPIEEPGLGVAYVYPFNGKYGVIAYAGNAGKPAFHYVYRTDLEVDQKLKTWFDGLRAWKDRVKSRRAEDFAGHDFKARDIVYYSWGYDQTNVDWFRVIRTTKNYVWLQPVVADVEETQFMAGNSQPAIDTSDPDPTNWNVLTKGEVTKHRAAGKNITMKFGSASKWDGRTVGCSWYA